MSRALRVLDATDVDALHLALADALAGDGPAILPLDDPSAVSGLPSTVEKRIAVVVQTSGSTGTPKRVALSADALLASAAASDSALGGPGQWLLALPAHYIAGVAVLVRSLAAQIEPVVMRSDGFTAQRFVAACAGFDRPVRYTSLVPTQLARLLESEDAIDALARFDRILIGGQAMPQSLAVRALELGLNITRTYGSSETSGGCVWDGVPIGTSAVRVIDGRVELGGPNLAEGYLDDPRRTALSFTQADGQRWYRTDDAGILVDGVLSVTGRLDDVIVSGGVKVSLSEVEAAVRSLPGLHDAVVVGAPSAQWGQVPVVVTTLRVSLDELRSAVANAIGRPAAPASILIVDSIPMLSSGKPDRVTLTALALQ